MAHVSHEMQDMLWSFFKWVASAWVLAMSFMGVLVKIHQSRFKTVFKTFESIATRFENLDKREEEKAKEHREEMRGMMSDHRKEMEGMRNQIFQIVQGGR